jgi:hypothetical protein
MDDESLVARPWLGQLRWSVILFLFSTALSCLGNTYFVDSRRGNDSAPGRSEDTAWKTLAKVNSTAYQPGDQVLFAKGAVWNEELLVSSSGTAPAPIIFGGYGQGEPPLIDAQSIRNRGISILNKAFVTVDGLAVRNSTSISIEVFNSQSVNIKNCFIQNSKRTAISVGGKSPDIRIEGCRYSQDPGFSMDGAFVSVFTPVDSAVVSNNEVTNFTGRFAISFMDVNNAVASGNKIDGGGIGIAINACTRNLTGGKIHHNTISNISSAYGDGEAVELTGHVGAPNLHCEQDKKFPSPVFTVSADIYNNVVMSGSSTFGAIDGWHAVNSKVYGNEITGMKKYGMQWTAGSDSNEFFRNTIRGSGEAAFAIYAGSGTGSANIHHNVIEGGHIGISADPTAKIQEDYNQLSGVGFLRSNSIPAGPHTSMAR